jgi:putative GTP pyrophosphokinase
MLNEKEELRKKLSLLTPYLEQLSENIYENFKEMLPSDLKNVDRISYRVKDEVSFIRKAFQLNENDERKYQNPLYEIQDMIGIRIIVFYKQDVEYYSNIILKAYREIEDKNYIPDDESKFGYEGRHLILTIPLHIFNKYKDIEFIPRFFELQVKTLYQHAWSESNHDLIYKPQFKITSQMQRSMAFVAAQSWGADKILSELYDEVTKNHKN